MDLQNFGDDENWLGSLWVGNRKILIWGLVKLWKLYDVGGRHLGKQGFWCGLSEEDRRMITLADF